MQRLQQIQPLALNAEEQRVVADLVRNGYADIAGLIDPGALARVQAATTVKVDDQQLREVERLNQDKNYWERLLDEDMVDGGRQPSESPFVQLAVHEPVLRIAAGYFRDAPLLDYVYLLHSTFKPGPYRVSQLWHKDYDDTRILKLFVYLTDCENDADGPFTFLPADISRKIGFSLHSHRSDEALGIKDLDKAAISWRSKKLSAFLVDTSRCYHMGSRVQDGHERLLYMAAYATYPKYNGRPTVRFRLDGTESPIQRIALSYP